MLVVVRVKLEADVELELDSVSVVQYPHVLSHLPAYAPGAFGWNRLMHGSSQGAIMKLPCSGVGIRHTVMLQNSSVAMLTPKHVVAVAVSVVVVPVVVVTEVVDAEVVVAVVVVGVDDAVVVEVMLPVVALEVCDSVVFSAQKPQEVSQKCAPSQVGQNTISQSRAGSISRPPTISGHVGMQFSYLKQVVAVEVSVVVLLVVVAVV